MSQSMETREKLRLYSERVHSIKQLSGFRKGSRLPDQASEGTHRWVASMAESEMDDDLQSTLDRLREQFRFKRRELQIEGPIEGIGTIQTPCFTYQISVQASEDDPTQVKWCRELKRIRAMERILTTAFDESFPPAMWTLEIPVGDELDIEDVIDNIEDAENQAIRIHYDKDCTWCDVHIEGVAGTLRVTPQAFVISPSSSIKPRQIFESLLAMRSRLSQIQSFDSFQG